MTSGRETCLLSFSALYASRFTNSMSKERASESAAEGETDEVLFKQFIDLPDGKGRDIFFQGI